MLEHVVDEVVWCCRFGAMVSAALAYLNPRVIAELDVSYCLLPSFVLDAGVYLARRNNSTMNIKPAQEDAMSWRSRSASPAHLPSFTCASTAPTF
jgi:hypothetical protein